MVRQIQTKKIRTKVTIQRKRQQENSQEKVIDTEKYAFVHSGIL